MRLSDGPSHFNGQVRQRHLHRTAADNSDAETGPNNGTGNQHSAHSAHIAHLAHLAHLAH